MTVERYRRKPDPRPEGELYVARYEPGRPLDDLRQVALMTDQSAEVAEAPLSSSTVLVVKYTNWDRDRPEPEFEVVRGGRYLAYSQSYGSLNEDDDADLRQFYEPAEQAHS